MSAQEKVQDRYVLDRTLGQGGMAEVWKAKDERLDRPVAIKFLSPHLTDDPEFLVRFFSEAQTVAAISHRNVVGVLDFGQHDGRPYLVMECVPGGAVTSLVGEPLLPERAFEIVEDAARGAAAAHAVGLVHRDIKPGNILLDDAGRAKLADFGISSSLGGENLTQTGTTIGSPHYISPEQVSGRSATPRSDVYSLGVVLYELLTGRKPIDADNVTAVAIAQVDQMPEPPSTLNPDLTPEIDAIVMRCLAKDPANRYGSAVELAGVLATHRTGLPASRSTAARGLIMSEEPEEEIGAGARRSLIGAAVVVLLLLAAGSAVIAGGTAIDPAGRDAEASVEKQPEVELTFSEESPAPSSSPKEAISAETEASKVEPKKEEKPEQVEEEADEPAPAGAEAKETPEPSSSPSPDPTPTEAPDDGSSSSSDTGSGGGDPQASPSP
ncbi:MAG: serine/threonine-protein kinase [Actinomycetota bacterium]